MTDTKQRQRALKMHQRMLANQQRRYRNRFTESDGDYRDQQEGRQRAEEAMRQAREQFNPLDISR